uniref:Uncharacterized protein n=1 Tax=Daucus carota subsp. sativus TaxID=79200 RepID=A0A161ZLP4_DAUCS
MMDLDDSIECISTSDLDESVLSPHLSSSTKPYFNKSPNGFIHRTTSVHELLECPVCTNSMYPPIHQVAFFIFLSYGVGSFGHMDLINTKYKGLN